MPAKGLLKNLTGLPGNLNKGNFPALLRRMLHEGFILSGMSQVSQPGFFISFEGSEGCGKSTQIGILMRSLREQGLNPLLVREPGGTPVGEIIRHLLQHAPEGDEMVPEAELLLFAASRAQLVRQVILPALAENRVVISDRFLDSTTVYQGVARKIGSESVDLINRFAAGVRLPDVTFLLDMDEAVAMERLRIGRGPEALHDRMEGQPADFYRAVRNGYLNLARSEPQRIRIMDATLPPEALASRIRHELSTFGHALLQRIRA
jgi:dTMP kinase